MPVCNSVFIACCSVFVKITILLKLSLKTPSRTYSESQIASNTRTNQNNFFWILPQTFSAACLFKYCIQNLIFMHFHENGDIPTIQIQRPQNHMILRYGSMKVFIMVTVYIIVLLFVSTDFFISNSFSPRTFFVRSLHILYFDAFGWDNWIWQNAGTLL